MDTLEIGGTPAEENCAQVGVTEDFDRFNRLECQAYIAALQKKYGQEPEGAILVIRSNPHDFGSYREVACKFDPENEVARNYAYECEKGLASWEDVDFWTPVSYHASQAIEGTIFELGMLDKATNPKAYPTAAYKAVAEGETVAA